MRDQQTTSSPTAGGCSLDRLAATLALDEPVGKVKGVSPARARVLEGKDISTVRDLLTHYPHRYIDMSQLEKVAGAPIGAMCTIAGEIHEIKLKKPKPRLSLVEIALTDDTGLLMVTCFRQPWLKDSLSKGMRVAVSGKVEFNYGFKRMTNPFIEVLEDDAAQDCGLIVPVHPATEKISTAWMRRFIANALDQCRGMLDPVPLALRARYRLFSRGAALSAIHFPKAMADAEEARRRLAYEEVLLLELHLMTEAAKRSEGRPATAHAIDGKRVQALQAGLPFTLTDEQKAAREEVLAVMAKCTVASHLILGDVGTGKTIVAGFALAACADTGTQALMMAPTEVLARQYGENLGPLLDEAGVFWEVLTGSTPAAERAAILERAKAGTIDVLFGTHALIEDDVSMRHCSLVVIDEQHRFGVDQRARLLAKGEAPDALYLTATPIPRSLALAVYGDLTLSYIRQRPTNTAGNETRVLTKGERGHAYDAALAALRQGRQVYVVCPLVGDSASQDEGEGKAAFEQEGESYEYASIRIEDEGDIAEGNLKAAKQEAAFLQAKTFFDYKVDLLYGGMSGVEKHEAMQRFRSGATQVLVATTVIEVGVDVPNASVMIVEDADRFGLAQLHQLRGRVGRGDTPGEVFLISASKAPPALERLAAMERTQDGFELASYDLSLRREGDILGNRQHGASILKLVNVVRDGKVIEAAHSDALEILGSDPHMEAPEHEALGREMRLAFKGPKTADGG